MNKVCYLHVYYITIIFTPVLSKGSPLPFEIKELSPDGRPIIGLFFVFLVNKQHKNNPH